MFVLFVLLVVLFGLHIRGLYGTQCCGSGSGRTYNFQQESDLGKIMPDPDPSSTGSDRNKTTPKN
jgi:hypothetical protein